jgi:hypothetical protein
MGWAVNATPRLLYPRERPSILCIGGWVGPRAGLNGCGKSCPPPGFDPRTVQPVASCYTDWAIPALMKEIINAIKIVHWTCSDCGLRDFWHGLRRNILPQYWWSNCAERQFCRNVYIHLKYNTASICRRPRYERQPLTEIQKLIFTLMHSPSECNALPDLKVMRWKENACRLWLARSSLSEHVKRSTINQTIFRNVLICSNLCKNVIV